MTKTLAPTWTFASLRSGYERTCDLYLYPELDCSSMVDDYYEESGQVQLEQYVRYLRERYPHWMEKDAVPIYWVVQSKTGGVSETAPPFVSAYAPAGDRHFLTSFTWPVNAVTGDPLDWFSLPVVNNRFPAFAEALSWTPSPLQPFCPLASILRSRNQQPPVVRHE